MPTFCLLSVPVFFVGSLVQSKEPDVLLRPRTRACNRRTRSHTRSLSDASRQRLAPSPTCHAAARWFPRKWNVVVSTTNIASWRQPSSRKEDFMASPIPNQRYDRQMSRRGIVALARRCSFSLRQQLTARASTLGRLQDRAPPAGQAPCEPCSFPRRSRPSCKQRGGGPCLRGPCRSRSR